MDKKKNKKFKILSWIYSLFFLCLFNINSVMAIEKIEGGNITISSLEKIVKNLAVQFQVFGICVAFIACVVFTIQFILGDDETKQRRKKTIIYTLLGVIVLLLIPSILNFIIDNIK